MEVWKILEILKVDGVGEAVWKPQKDQEPNWRFWKGRVANQRSDGSLLKERLEMENFKIHGDYESKETQCK